jgi:hypothetical protein
VRITAVGPRPGCACGAWQSKREHRESQSLGK